MIDTGETICEVVPKLQQYQPASISVISPYDMFNGVTLENLCLYVHQGYDRVCADIG